jgi:DNA-binding response OmpR family regulator
MQELAGTTILLVEDDLELRQLVSQRLTEENYAVRTASTGTEALESVKQAVPDLVLLDVMLPELDGIEVCRRLRADFPLLYIVMLTARSQEMDRVVGLEVGADDYITKPFSLNELVARIRSALRRIRLTEERLVSDTDDGEAPEALLTFGPLSIDPNTRSVSVDEEDRHLTVREYDLLLFLARHAGRPFTRSQLLERVWEITYEGYDRTIDSHVQRLRSKIEENPGNPRFIKTVWGVGYKLDPDVEP